MADDNGRINVSKDFLRAELGRLELNLVTTLATKAEVEHLEGRVNVLEIDVDRLKMWRKSLAAAVALLAAVLVASLPLVVRHYVG